MSRLAVIVAAWNEAETIGETLTSLALQEEVWIDAVVVANGCTDETSEIARNHISLFQRHGHSLRVLEVDGASKSAALNVGEAGLVGYPRVFLDADVLLTPNALIAVARVLAVAEPMLAAPCLKFTSAKGRPARIAQLLENLPPLCNDVVGGGFYAVNYEGRQRWDRFPPVIADDAYVCGLFRRNERVRVSEATFSARFPTEEALVGVLARWRAGRQQLERIGFNLAANSRGKFPKVLIFKPHLWIGAAEYACVRWAARRRAARMLAARDFSWSRADSSPTVRKQS